MARGKEILIKDMKQILTRIIPQKSTTPNVHFPRDITMMRAFVYSLACDESSNGITVEAFLAGCNRYGLDNPCPIITKRLGLYGMPDDLEKDFKRLVEKYKRDHPEINVDPDVYGPAELKGGMNLEQTHAQTTKGAKQVCDFKETLVRSPLRKTAGIKNINLLPVAASGDAKGSVAGEARGRDAAK
jgi:hypothetical protein